MEFALPLRSRYAETDQMGYVYHGHFLSYFEMARTEMIRGLGMSYADLERQGYLLPVHRIEIEFKEPLLYDELFTVHTSIYTLPSVRLETWYRVTDASGAQLKALGQVTLIFTSAATRKPVRAPALFLDTFR
jgi:acyl-CoA thioester hydrolase